MSRHNYTPEQIEFLVVNVKGRSHKELTNMFNVKFNLQMKVRQITTALNGRKIYNETQGKIYTTEHISFLKDNAAGRTRHDLTAMLNNEFGLSFKYEQICSALKFYGIRCGTRNNYTQEQLAFITKNVTGRELSELVDMFNSEYGLNLNIEQMKSILRYRKLYNGQGRLFIKGHTVNCMPLGAERIDSDGYIYTKVANPNIWRFKHIVIWEAANGSVPKDCCINFADGNNRNFALDNLIKVTKQQHRMMTSKKLRHSNAELTKVGAAIAEVLLKINERRAQAEEG